ncbi:MAG: GHMP kinase [Chitinivibrionales bacterium]|nr:GHMP kinase [Chitinivibrionales bacterium]
MIIRTQAFPRAALIGNPSDGYFGKTIAFTFRNFYAGVVLYESPELEILPSVRDHSVFQSIQDLVLDVNHHGYYGGIRLLKAAIKVFHDYCSEKGIVLHNDNFTIRYSSNIPHLVGLAGSSAIITACFRALMAYYGVKIVKPVLANLILSVEKEQLGISAGLQDRVAQVYQGPVYMDFNQKHMDEKGYGIYEMLSRDQFPSLYIAYRADLSEGSDIFHNNLRERFNRGESEVIEAMGKWGELTDKVHDSLVAKKNDRIHDLLNENFDIRRKLCRISKDNIAMVEAARGVGASAKFTGSGGAIIGTYTDETMFQSICEALTPTGVEVIKPDISPESDE